MSESRDKCPCGGIILADTEDWEVPLCYYCCPKEYDALKAENEELTKIIAQTSYDPESTYRRLENLRKENEMMREALEDIAYNTEACISCNKMHYALECLAKLSKKEGAE